MILNSLKCTEGSDEDRGSGWAAGQGGGAQMNEGGELRRKSWAGIAGTRNHWSWKGTGNPGKRHGEVTRGKKIIK